MRLDSTLPVTLRSTLTVASLGKEVLEQTQTTIPRQTSRPVLTADFGKAPLCAHMVGLLRRLGSQPPQSLGPVLENISVLMCVRNDETDEILFCAGMLFDVAQSGNNSSNVYRLVDGEDMDARRFTC